MSGDDYNTVLAMETRGGEFVRHLSAAYVVADDDNRAIIRKAFHEIWGRYAAMAKRMAKAREEGA